MRERGTADRARRIGRAVRERLSYANVMATIAVFGVLAGGGAYAASKIGASDIAKNAVRSKHIKKNAVKTAKIKNGAVTAPKLAAGVAPGVSGLVRVLADPPDQDSTSGKSSKATCPAGKRVIGAAGEITGGVSGADPNQLTDVVIDEIFPSSEDVVPGTVTVRAFEEEPTNVNWSVRAIALCANVS